MKTHAQKPGTDLTFCGRDVDAVQVTRTRPTCKACMRSMAALSRPVRAKAARPPQARPAHRPGILTQQMADEICDTVRQGNFLQNAAALAGVSVDSVYRWAKRGARWKRIAEQEGGQIPPDERVYTDFSDALKKAQAECQTLLTAGIRAHGFSDPKFWQALAWLLERMFPHLYGRKQAVTVSQGENIEAPEIDLDRLSSDQLRQMDKLLAAASADDASALAVGDV